MLQQLARAKNIILYVVLGACLIGGGFSTPASIEIFEDNTGNVDDFILGDTDGDGSVTIDDAKLILRASIGLEDLSINKAMFERADYDGDGTLTASDCRAALRVSFGLEPAVSVAPPRLDAATIKLRQHYKEERNFDKPP